MIHLALGVVGLICCAVYFARRYPVLGYAIVAFAAGAIVARLTA
jgi:hypothetical protein